MEKNIEKDIADRLRRMETKLTKMAISMGVSEETTMPITVDQDRIHIAGYDVNLSTIKRRLQQLQQFELHTTMDLYVAGELAMQLTFIGD